jgi:NADH-quinone oxidoreductase subunit J
MVYALYIASAVGAVALFMMAPRRGYSPARLGGLLGAMTLGGLWLTLAPHLPELGPDRPAMAYYYLFSAIALVAATRTITHKRPVYSALWTVMTILSSAGLLLLLGASFVAFAMIIIYGGAILVTYMFVIMLALHARAEQITEATDYERTSREPLAAIAVSFLLLAVLLTVAFEPMTPNPDAAGPTDAALAQQLTQRPAHRLAQRMGLDDPARTQEADALAVRRAIGDDGRLDNVEHVGMDLFHGHPLGLELAGVILLVAMVGAVVIARQKVDPATESPPPADARPRDAAGEPASIHDA